MSEISAHTRPVRYPRTVPKNADCAAKLKTRTLTNLYNESPAWLEAAHQKLDKLVFDAYGWPPDLSDDDLLALLLFEDRRRIHRRVQRQPINRPAVARPRLPRVQFHPVRTAAVEDIDWAVSSITAEADDNPPTSSLTLASNARVSSSSTCARRILTSFSAAFSAAR